LILLFVAYFIYCKISSLIILALEKWDNFILWFYELFGIISIMFVLTSTIGAFSRSTAKKPVPSVNNAVIPSSKYKKIYILIF